MACLDVGHLSLLSQRDLPLFVFVLHAEEDMFVYILWCCCDNHKWLHDDIPVLRHGNG